LFRSFAIKMGIIRLFIIMLDHFGYDLQSLFYVGIYIETLGGYEWMKTSRFSVFKIYTHIFSRKKASLRLSMELTLMSTPVKRLESSGDPVQAKALPPCRYWD